MEESTNRMKNLKQLLEIEKKVRSIKKLLEEYYKKARYMEQMDLNRPPEEYINIFFDNLEEAKTMYIMHAILSGRIEALKAVGLPIELEIEVDSNTSTKTPAGTYKVKVRKSQVCVNNAIVWAFKFSTSELTILDPTGKDGEYVSQIEIPTNSIIFAKMMEGEKPIYGYKPLSEQNIQIDHIPPIEKETPKDVKKMIERISALIRAQTIISLYDVKELLNFSEEDIRKVFKKLEEDYENIILQNEEVLIDIYGIYNKIKNIFERNFGLIRYEELHEHIRKIVGKKDPKLANLIIEKLKNKKLIYKIEYYVYNEEVIASKVKELKYKGLDINEIKKEFLENFHKRKIYIDNLDTILDIISKYTEER